MSKRDWQQLELFSPFPQGPQPGEYVEAHGKELCFDDLRKYIGKIIIMDKSTENYTWWQAVQVEEIYYNSHENCDRLIYYHGHRQRGLVDDYYFAGPKQKGCCRPVRIWEAQPNGS